MTPNPNIRALLEFIGRCTERRYVAPTLILAPCEDASELRALLPFAATLCLVAPKEASELQELSPGEAENVTYVPNDPLVLPIPDGGAHLAVIAQGVSDLSGPSQRALVRELTRVVRPDGAVVLVADLDEMERPFSEVPLLAMDAAARGALLEAFPRVVGMVTAALPQRLEPSASRRENGPSGITVDPSLAHRQAEDLRLPAQAIVVCSRGSGGWLTSAEMEAISELHDEPSGGNAKRFDLNSRRNDREQTELYAEVANLRLQLDRDLYRIARRLRGIADQVPFGVSVLKWAWRRYSVARGRLRDTSSTVPITLKPPGAEYPLRDIWMTRRAPVVSIIVLNLNNGPLTLQCLQSIWTCTEGAPYEVIVVDNGSEAHHAAALRPYLGHFREVNLSVNRFFGEGNNLGAEDARGEILIFLNNDVVVTPDWLEPLLGAVTEPSIGIAGARLLFADGRIQETGAIVRPDASALQLEKGLAYEDVPQSGLVDVDYCSGACLAIGSELFQRVGGFDYCWEPAYYEDTDLCFKVRSLKLRVVAVRSSAVVHLEHATTARRSRTFDLRGQPEFNQGKFLDRWGPVLRQEVEIGALASALAAAPGDLA